MSSALKKRRNRFLESSDEEEEPDEEPDEEPPALDDNLVNDDMPNPPPPSSVSSRASASASAVSRLRYMDSDSDSDENEFPPPFDERRASDFTLAPTSPSLQSKPRMPISKKAAASNVTDDVGTEEAEKESSTASVSAVENEEMKTTATMTTATAVQTPTNRSSGRRRNRSIEKKSRSPPLKSSISPSNKPKEASSNVSFQSNVNPSSSSSITKRRTSNATTTHTMSTPTKEAPSITTQQITSTANNTNTTTNPTNNHSNTTKQVCLTIQSELHNMGKALTCPLCLHTLQSPVHLPCLHAFCKTCLTTHVSHSSNSSKEKGSRRGMRSHSSSSSCPVCKSKCTKRSMEPNGLLSDLVTGYKLALRSFGFAPVVYDDAVGMTQIQEVDAGESFISQEDEEDEEESIHLKGGGGGDLDSKYVSSGSSLGSGSCTRSARTGGAVSKAKPSLRQCHEHLEVSRTVHSILKNAIHTHTHTAKEQPPPTGCGTSSTSAITSASTTTTTTAHGTLSATSLVTQGDSTTNSHMTRRSTRSSNSNKSSSSKSKSSIPTRQRLTYEEIQHKNQLQRLEFLLKDQEDVVNADSRALVQAAVSKMKKSRSSGAGTTTTTATTTTSKKGEEKDTGRSRAVVEEELQEGDTRQENEMPNVNMVAKMVTSSSSKGEKAGTALIVEDTRGRVRKEGKERTSVNTTKYIPLENSRTEEGVLVGIVTEQSNENGNDISDLTMITIAAAEEKRSNSFATRDPKDFHIEEDGVVERDIIVDSYEKTTVGFDSQPMMPPSTSKDAVVVCSLTKKASIEPDPSSPALLPKMGEKETSQSSQNFFSATETKFTDSIPTVLASQDIMDDAREKEAADRSGEWLEEEIREEEDRARKSIEKCREVDGTNLVAQVDDQEVALKEQETISQASLTTDKFLSASSQQPSFKTRTEITTTIQNKKNPLDFKVGSIVKVQARTWPGMNKLGGVARIIKVHSLDIGTKYDVSFILGGKERLVDSTFISSNDDADDDIDSAAKVLHIAAMGTAGTRQSRRVGTRQKEQQEEMLHAIELEKENKLDKFKQSGQGTDTNVCLEQSRKRKRAQILKEPPPENTEQINKRNTESPVGKRRRKTERKKKVKKQNTAARGKRRFMEEPVQDASENDQHEKSTTSAISLDLFNEVVALPSSDLMSLAKKRYQTLLFSSGRKNKKQVLNITTSGLNEQDEANLKRFCKMMRGKTTIKILSDFVQGKTNLCVTSVSEKKSSDQSLRSKMRTLKTMRAALAGVPILAPSFITSCLKEGALLEPDDSNYIQTLPVKMTDTSPCDEFGVLKFGALYQKYVESSPPLLFKSCSIHLCGQWKKSSSKTKDVQTLLNEGGADILPEIEEVINELQGMNNRTVVFLCDDNITNSGLTAKASSRVKNAISELHKRDKKHSIPSVLVVNSNWIFDCVSCAQILPCEKYEPKTSNTRSLWLYLMECNAGTSSERR